MVPVPESLTLYRYRILMEPRTLPPLSPSFPRTHKCHVVVLAMTLLVGVRFVSSGELINQGARPWSECRPIGTE